LVKTWPKLNPGAESRMTELFVNTWLLLCCVLYSRVREFIADEAAMDVLQDVLGGDDDLGLDDDDDDPEGAGARGGGEDEDFSAFM
jgi:hypothetical protein